MQNVSLDRLAVLDGMRGFAILLVVFYHLSLVSGYGLPFLGALDVFAHGGFLGVDLFFFVSGCCIAYPYARARSAGRTPPGTVEFARRRFFKIAPSYALAVAVFAVAYHARFDGIAQEATHVLAHAAFVHVWFRDTYGSFSGPLWTLGVEVQFYVLFACLAPQVVRRPVTVYAAFVAVAAAYRAAIAGAGLNADFVWVNQLPAVLDIFGAGMLTAMALSACEVARPRILDSSRRATVLACVALALACAALLAADAAGRATGDDGVRCWLNAWRIAFGPVLGVLTLGVTFGSAWLRNAVGTRALLWLSVVSYNTYLWNLEVAVTLHAAGLAPWATFWLAGVATFGLAAIVTYRFERPLYRLGLASGAGLGLRLPALVPAWRAGRAPGLQTERP